MAWSEEQFDQYVEEAYALIESAQSKLEQQYGLGHFERWDLDQTTEKLVFSNSSGPAVTCNVYALGTYGGGIWKWAWANDSILPSFSQKSRGLKKLASLSGMDVFELEAFEADESMPWEISGMALKEIGGLGVYSCPSKSSSLFVVIDRVASNQ